MKRSFESDYAFGTQSEVSVLSQLKVIDPSLVKTIRESHPFDFVNGTATAFVELKTRNNTKDRYPTTMIPLSKIKWANENYPAEFYFAFKFTDGLYYIKYDSAVFSKFEVGEGGRFDRGRPELNQYCFIPIDTLLQL